ncbi:MAG TPA: GldG family protein [Candidatus Competibacter sp.]|nr:GldG family protein [Candidatus Competibacter sp.]
MLFLLLFGLILGLLAWFSSRYAIQADWTAGGRNTLSEPSRALLARMSEPVRITAYARDNPTLRDGIGRLIERYRRDKPNLTLTFVNPDLLPDRARELGVTLDGELYVEYRGRGEKVQQLSEQALTMALQRLSRQPNRAVLFLEGHGERKPLGMANYDLGAFGRELEKIGIPVHSVDLSKEQRIPSTTAVLVIAGPQQPLPPGEVQLILDYVMRGGNLLWLLEPGGPSGLQALAAALGIVVLPGVVVDPDTSRLGIKNPAFIPIVDYGPHPITESLRAPALLPQAAALDVRPTEDWNSTALLESQSRSWTETDSPDGPIRFDPDTVEQAGPLTVGVALFRSIAVNGSPAPTQQRLVIVGDGDFLSNTYLGNGANLELGLNILNWLTLDDAPIIVRPKAVPDPNLDLSDSALALIAATFLVAIPAGLLASGWLIWFRRRRR